MKHNDGEMHLAVQIVLLTIGTVGLLAGIVLAIINGIAGNWLGLSIALHFILGAISALAILTWHKWGWYLWLGVAASYVILNSTFVNFPFAGNPIVATLQHIYIIDSLVAINSMVLLLKVKKYGVSTFDMLE